MQNVFLNLGWTPSFERHHGLGQFLEGREGVLWHCEVFAPVLITVDDPTPDIFRIGLSLSQHHLPLDPSYRFYDELSEVFTAALPYPFSSIAEQSI